MTEKTLKLPSAFYPPENRQIHISEKILDKKNLFCPFCDGKVGVREGPIRIRHFYHLSDSSEAACPAKKEELLHEGAKAFLFFALKERKSLDIIVQDIEKLPPDFSELFKYLGITGFTIPTSSLQSFFCESIRMEKKIDGIRPDITSFDHRQNPVFAWEIFVTHSIEEQKRKHLDELGYGYLELKPAPLEPTGYAFFLESFGGFELLRKKDLLDFLFDQKKTELLDSYEWKLCQDYRVKIFQEEKEKAEKRVRNDLKRELAKEMQITGSNRLNQITDELRRAIISNYTARIDKVDTEKILDQLIENRKLYSAFKKKTCLTILAEKTSNSKMHFTEEMKLVEFVNFESIRINNNFELISLPGIFSAFLQEVSEKFSIKGLIAKKTKNGKNETQIVGFEMILDDQNFDKQRFNVVLDDSQTSLQSVPLSRVLIHKSKKTQRQYCCIATVGGEIFVNNYVKLFQLILSRISEFYKCEAIMIKNDSGKFNLVGLKIHNLCLPEFVDREIKELLKAAIEKFKACI